MGAIALRRIYAPLALLEDGFTRDVLITIEDRAITAVAAGVPPPADAERLTGVTVPGVANVHSHGFQRALAGLAEVRAAGDDNFWSWRTLMYRFLAQLTPDDVEAIAAWSQVEMLEAGFTSVGEFHYLHHDRGGMPYADRAEMAGRIVAAAAASGIGLTLLPAFYAHGGCGARPPRPEQARFVSDLAGFYSLMAASARHVAALPGAVLGIAPHSLRAVSDVELRALAAAFTAGPIHMHAAEQAAEVAECVAWSGASPIAWLLDNVGLDARWCLVHATHMRPQESVRLAASGTVAGVCPITEANLGDGIFAGARFLATGGRLGVGSDSNVRISLAEELRTLEYGQRLRDGQRNCFAAPGGSTGRALFDAARRGGAQALGAPAGAIAPGRVADLVVLDDRHPALVGRSGDRILDAWIFAGGDGVVRDVFAGGTRVVAGGHHRERERLYARFAATVARLGSG
jgi:formiminoglutamate deiminase